MVGVRAASTCTQPVAPSACKQTHFFRWCCGAGWTIGGIDRSGLEVLPQIWGWLEGCGRKEPECIDNRAHPGIRNQVLQGIVPPSFPPGCHPSCIWRGGCWRQIRGRFLCFSSECQGWGGGVLLAAAAAACGRTGWESELRSGLVGLAGEPAANATLVVVARSAQVASPNRCFPSGVCPHARLLRSSLGRSVRASPLFKRFWSVESGRFCGWPGCAVFWGWHGAGTGGARIRPAWPGRAGCWWQRPA